MVARATDEPARVCPLVANELAATTAPATRPRLSFDQRDGYHQAREGQHDPESEPVLCHLRQHALVEQRRGP